MVPLNGSSTYPGFHLSRVDCINSSPEAAGTAQFCLLMDTFFDIMNVKNIDEREFNKKPSLAPFSSANDSCFSRLRNVFFQYFEDWYNSIQEGLISAPNAPQKIFIS